MKINKVVNEFNLKINGMTIEDIYRRGGISNRTRNICISNQIKTFKDLKLHYVKSETFRNLRYCGEKSNDELIGVYNKYKDRYVEDKINQSVSINKSKLNLYNLDDIVTDLNEVIKLSPTDAIFKKLEQRLKDHWRDKADKKTIQIDTTELPVKTTLETDTVDLRSIEQKLKEYWIESAEKEAQQNKSIVSSKKTFDKVTDVVDLKEIEQTIEDYRRRQDSEEITGHY